jgi:alkylation response protein AidB-like acyl-CoA dehydrogenase
MPSLGDPENGLPLVERVVDEARIALCSEAVGADGRVAEGHGRISQDAPAVRRAIGTFQSLQHRGSDMFVALEQARGMACSPRWRSDLDDKNERSRRSRRPRCRSAAPASIVGSSRSSFTAASA